MIAKSWFRRYWQWKIGGCVALVGALSVGVSESVLAQIVPDNTLGAEGSVVTPDDSIQGIPSERIDGGATRGANLFHSFEQFNVGAGRGAYFTNPAGIENILSRVTGANRSDILGRLGVLGNANLFLLNPNGIVFGPAASLDVQGSFLATTANAVKLGDAGLFSASQPATSNLLTVSPSAFWFNAIAAQPIINQSRAQSLIGQLNSAGLSPGLQVQPGQTLALVGGNVLLEGGNLTAAGGRIELGSVAGVGEVSLTSSGNRFVLGYDSMNDFGNISLSNRAFVDASGEGGGDVQIRGARLEMTQRSNIWANNLGAQNGGGVLVRTTEVDLSESSLLTADVTGTGTGGNLTIDTGRLLVSDGAVVSAVTYGEGKGGSLQINTSESVNVIGGSANGGFGSGLLTQSNGSGNAGELRIDTGRLLVSDGAVVSAGTYGEGNGGSLQINASESVDVIGTSTDDTQPRRSGLLAQSNGSGDAGELRIDTGRLLVSDGAEVSAGTYGEGNGGSLQINASESVNVIGTSTDTQPRRSGLLAQSNGSGDAGELRIDTGRLLVSDGAEVSAGTYGEGNGGSLQINTSESVNVIGTSTDTQPRRSGLLAQSNGSGNAGELRIDTGRLLVSDGAEVSAGTYGEGNGGSLQINASESVNVIGGSANGGFGSGLLTQSNGSGNAGELRIDTGRLLVSDGAEVSAGTYGEGNGGNLQINASESVNVIGTSTDDTQRRSGLYAQSNGSGNAGELRIDTERLLVSDGAEVSAGTFGEGKGGSLQINASESVEVIGGSGGFGSGLLAQSYGRGDAGDLTIETERLLVSDGAEVSAGTFGEGNGGRLQINASESVNVIGTSGDGQRLSSLLAQTDGSGDAGDLTIETERLLVSDGAQVSAGTFAQSDGSGNAGNLSIATGRLLVSNGAAISNRSRGEGTAGNINITAHETLQAVNGSIETNTSRSAGGAITIQAGDIRLEGDSDIRTDVASGTDNGGTITLTADSIVAFDDSDILAYARDGRGGDITLNTPAFFGQNYRPAPRNTNPDPDTLDNNNRVDANATGAVSGVITTPDVSFIQNSLSELPENQIDTDSLLANSCIVRRNQPTRGSFTITGTGGLPQRPGDTQMSSFPTVDVETLPSDSTSSTTNPNRPWQKGDPFVEPQGVYRLPNGKLVLSRECS